jgi:uncharacterized protein (TIGR02186 family)
MIRALGPALAVLVALAATPAQAEKLVSAISSNIVQITSSFDGAKLNFFGTIEPEDPAEIVTGPYNIIIVVTGPLQDRVTRLKTNTFGIWTNTDQVQFKHFPSYYAVLSSGRLDSVATDEVLTADVVLPEYQARASAADGGTVKSAEFSTQLVRLMTEQGHFAVDETAVKFLSNTAYIAQVTLPSDVANGPFLTHTLVLKDRQLVAETTQGFAVRKSGFENFVFVMSRQQPLLYGLICVALALTTGWLAGVAFRR